MNYSAKLPMLDETLTTRFKIQEGIYVKTYGRVIFSSIMKILESKNQVSNLFMLYGTIGCGKSHLLLAIACYLLKKGNRVLYFTDPYNFFSPRAWIRGLFLLKLLELLKPTETRDNMFLNQIEIVLESITTQNLEIFLQSKILYLSGTIIIIDQFEQLGNLRKTLLLNFFRGYECPVILASIAIDEISKGRMRNIPMFDINFIDIFSGFSNVEYNVWLGVNQYKLPPMTKVQKDELKGITGAIPIYLDAFANINISTFKDRITDFFHSECVCKMESTIAKFYESKIDSPDLQKYIQYGRICFGNRCLSVDAIDYICNTYFYISTMQNRKTRCSSSLLACWVLKKIFQHTFKIYDLDLLGSVFQLKIEQDPKIINALFNRVGKNQILTNGLGCCDIKKIDKEILSGLYKYIFCSLPMTIFYHCKTNIPAVDAIVIRNRLIIGVNISKSVTPPELAYDQFTEYLLNTVYSMEELMGAYIIFCWMIFSKHGTIESRKGFTITTSTGLTLSVRFEGFIENVERAIESNQIAKSTILGTQV